MKKPLLLSTILLFMYSCSSPLDKKVNKETMEQDIKAIMASEKIDSTDKEILAMAFVANAMGFLEVEGKTYKDLLESAKKEQAEREKLEAQEKLKEAERIKKLTSTVDVVFLDKKNSSGNYSTYSDFKISIVNKSQKDVKAVQGILIFNDILNNEIKGIRITYDNLISAGESVTEEYSVEINEFIDSDMTLYSKNYDKLKMVWKPEKILLEDGTILE